MHKPIRKLMRKLILAVLLSTLLHTAWADSKRIDVYPQGRAYVDVKAGDTLSDLIQRALPSGGRGAVAVIDDVVALNPQAFIDGDANRLKTGVRLWLPGYVASRMRAASGGHHRIESFSWGYIKHPR